MTDEELDEWFENVVGGEDGVHAALRRDAHDALVDRVLGGNVTDADLRDVYYLMFPRILDGLQRVPWARLSLEAKERFRRGWERRAATIREQSFADAESIVPELAGPLPPDRSPSQRPTWLGWTLAAGGLTLVAVVLWLVVARGDDDEEAIESEVTSAAEATVATTVATTGAPTTSAAATTTGAPTTSAAATTTGAPTTSAAATTTGAPTTSAAATTTTVVEATSTTAGETTGAAPLPVDVLTSDGSASVVFPASFPAGGPVPIEVVVVDASGAPRAGVPWYVTVGDPPSSPDATHADTVTDADGRAVFELTAPATTGANVLWTSDGSGVWEVGPVEVTAD